MTSARPPARIAGIVVIPCFFAGACCLFPPVCADKSVSLNLKAVVDPVLNIVRVDEAGDIDVLNGNNSAIYRIFYNGANGVDVQFASQNDWKLAHSSGQDQTIEYTCFFNKTQLTDNHRIVASTEFSAGQYEFEAAFQIKEKQSCNYEPGKYYDRVTISITETQ